MSFIRFPTELVLLATLLAGCVETIDVSMRVTSGHADGGCVANPSGMGVNTMNRYKVTTYRPGQGGTCCTTKPNMSCKMDVIETVCVSRRGGSLPTADTLNSDLAIAGLALSWDPDRSTCVQVAAFYDSTLNAAGDATPTISPCNDPFWTTGITEENVRICAHTTEPAVGTQLVEVDDTVCATDDRKPRALTCFTGKEAVR